MASTDGKHATFDTGRQHLGAVYAKALLGATQAAGNTQQVLDQLDSLLVDVLDRVPRLDAVLASPRVPAADKVAMLDRAFASGMQPLLLNFLKVVAQHGRLDCLRAVNHAAHEMWNELRGRVSVEFRSAQPLGRTDLDLVTSRLRTALKSELDVSQRVDPDMIGGLVVRIEDTLYDGSVRNRLSRLRGELLEETKRAIRESASRFAVES
jgi:F-type H+-transporting ATPase subunit delta